MDCLVLPVSILRRLYPGSRVGYKALGDDGTEEETVTVVVGKEKREFRVDPFVLDETPFRVLMDMATGRKEKKGRVVIVEDVDSILFEHMLWLMQNDCSSLFQLNLREIIDFYAQDN